MAFPWLGYDTFDDGTKGAFNTETDASSILDFPHYRELARSGLAPFQGAHAVRLRLAGDATAELVETDYFDTAAAGRIFVWFTVCIPENLTLADTNTVILFSLDSAGPVSEAVFGVRNNSGTYELFFGETGATRTFPIVRNNKRWYQIEMDCLIDNAGANDGTIQGYIDGAAVGAVIGTLDQGAITQGRYGAVSGTAAGNTGTILLGPIMADNARIYPRTRFGTEKWITRDQTAFIGSGVLDTVQLTGTSTDAVLTILDTDIYESTGLGFSREPLVYVRNVTANDQSPGLTTPVRFTKGCYVQLTGTNPEAFLSLRDECAQGVVMSSANYVDRANALKGRI